MKGNPIHGCFLFLISARDNQNIVPCMVTRYVLNGERFESQKGQDIFFSYSNAAVFFFLRYCSDRVLKVTAHWYLLIRLRMSGYIPPLSCVPSYFGGRQFNFTFRCCYGWRLCLLALAVTRANYNFVPQKVDWNWDRETGYIYILFRFSFSSSIKIPKLYFKLGMT